MTTSGRLAWARPFVGAAGIFLVAACGARVAADYERAGTSGAGASGNGGATGTGTLTSTGTSTATGTPTSTGTSTFTGTSSSTGTVSTSTSTGTSSGSTCPPVPPLAGPCAPSPACGSASVCVSHVAQSSATKLGFRIADLRFKLPNVFSSGIVGQTLAGSVLPSDAACNLTGAGTFSWLLQFDLAAGTLKTGGSKPAPSAAGPYSFLTAQIPEGPLMALVQPETMNAALTSCALMSSSKADVVLPVFLDQGASQAIVLPLHGLRFTNVTLSPDLNCIGRYDAEGLDPANNCLGTTAHPSFVDGGSLDAAIGLDDADHIMVNALNESLCVLLSGNAMKFGTPDPSGHIVCKRDAGGNVLFAGDWCIETDAAADAACHDAAKVLAAFAAQSVIIQ